MQQTSTVKFPVIFLTFKKGKGGLSVNETKPDTENAFNWDDVGFAVNNKSKSDEKALFAVSLQILDV